MRLNNTSQLHQTTPHYIMFSPFTPHYTTLHHILSRFQFLRNLRQDVPLCDRVYNDDWDKETKTIWTTTKRAEQLGVRPQVSKNYQTG